MTRRISPAEAEFLRTYDAGAFERPSVAVDTVVLAVDADALHVILIERPEHPFKGAACLPGGFLAIDEAPDAAARRVLRAKAGLTPDHLEQLFTFGAVERDPRGRILSIAQLAILRALPTVLPAGVASYEVDVPWEGETGGPAYALRDGKRVELGFDHAEILGLAVQRIRGKLAYTRIGFAFLPDRFTLNDVRGRYEVLLGRRLNKDSFRRKLLASHDLVPTGERQADVGHRPAELYRLGQRHVDPLSA